jgi:hypothetical protein
LNLYIKAIRAFKFPAESGSVQVFIGSEKLTLDKANDEVTKGTSKVDGATVSFPTVTDIAGDEGKIYEIQITHTPDDTEYLRAGEAYTDAVFGAFDIKYGGIFPDLDAASKDVVSVTKDGSTRVRLEFTNKAGDECSVSLYNTTNWAINNKPLAVTNPAVAYDNWTQAGNVSEGDYFLVGRDSTFNSYVLQYVSTDSTNNLIKVKDLCSGTTFDASTTTKFFYLGGDKYDFVVNTDSEVIRVNQTGGAASGKVPLYTPGKSKIELVTATAKSGEVDITEAPFSLAGIQGASQVTLRVNATVTSGEIDTITVTNASTAMAGSGMVAKDDSDYTYGVSQSGTYAVRDSDADTLTIYTPDVPTPVFVAVGADPVFSAGEGVTGGSVEQAVQIKNSVSKMESEITTASLDRDVVLLGGPCANSLVAELLEMSAVRGQCSTDFVAEYPTEGVITVVSNAFASGQKALVVAGVDRTATRNLAVKVMQGTVEYSA